MATFSFFFDKKPTRGDWRNMVRILRPLIMQHALTFKNKLAIARGGNVVNGWAQVNANDPFLDVGIGASPLALDTFILSFGPHNGQAPDRFCLMRDEKVSHFATLNVPEFADLIAAWLACIQYQGYPLNVSLDRYNGDAASVISWVRRLYPDARMPTWLVSSHAPIDRPAMLDFRA